MTTNEELIAEARRAAPGDCPTELAVMVHRLADALAAVSDTTPSERGYTTVAHAHTANGVIRAKSPAREITAQQLIDAIYDEDEDGTDDSVRFSHIFDQYRRLKTIYAGETQPAPATSDGERETLIEVLAEKLSDALPANAYGRSIREQLAGKILARGFRLTPPIPARDEWEAIKRVRELHLPTLPGFGPKSCQHDGRAWPCATIAALDGAPEPEEKP